MGGNALQSIVPGRMTPEEYKHISHAVLQYLSTIYDKVCLEIESPDKSSFGDVDVIALGTPKQPIQSAEIKHNGSTTHFAFHGRQIDVFHARDEEEFDFLRVCTSYGGLGPILGPDLKKTGFKLGMTQLSMHCPQISQNFVLTKNIDKVLEFVGLSRQRWDQGFHTHEQFVDWCRNNRLFYDPWEVFFDKALRFFGKEDEYFKIRHSFELKRQASDWIPLVRHWTNFEGPELGAFYKKLKSQFSSEDEYHLFFIKESYESLHKWVTDMAQEHAVFSDT